MAKRRGGTILVGTEAGLAVFNPETGALSASTVIDPETPGNRGNDGACDANGRFWFGTMMNNIGPGGEELPITAATGKLFRIDGDGAAQVMETGVGVSNGPCWSPTTRPSISPGLDGAGDLGLHDSTSTPEPSPAAGC